MIVENRSTKKQYVITEAAWAKLESMRMSSFYKVIDRSPSLRESSPKVVVPEIIHIRSKEDTQKLLDNIAEKPQTQQRKPKTPRKK